MDRRFFELREYLKIRQEDIGRRIGVTKSTISLIERGQRNASDRLIRDICREFNVNEEWLRTGNGEMFFEGPEEDEVAAYVYDILIKEDDEIKQLIVSIMRTYSKLDSKAKYIIKKCIRDIADDMRKSE